MTGTKKSFEELNFKATGGQFGKVRVAPYFTIVEHDNGTFYAKDDLCKFKSTVRSGFKSVDELVKSLQWDIDRRTRLD